MKGFPVKSYEGFEQKVLDGVTLYKSNRRWIALVVVETPYGRQLKLYAWVMRDGEWKVDLANLNIGYWNFKKFAEHAEKLSKKYLVSKDEEIPEEDPTTAILREWINDQPRGKKFRPIRLR